MIDTKVYELAQRFLEDCDIPQHHFETECRKLAQDIQVTIEAFIEDMPKFDLQVEAGEARDDMLGCYPDHRLPPI